MICVSVSGDSDFRESVIEATKNSQAEIIEIADEEGFDGQQAVEIALIYGPPVVSLLKSIVELIDVAIKTGKDASITVGKTKKRKRKG